MRSPKVLLVTPVKDPTRADMIARFGLLARAQTYSPLIWEIECGRSAGDNRNAIIERHPDVEYVVNGDVDDWISPTRVERQVATLEVSGRMITGSNRILVYDPARDTACWHNRKDPLCASLCYRREAWERAKYLPCNEAEYRNMLDASRREMLVVSDPTLMVWIRHDSNATGTYNVVPDWEARQAVHGLMGEDIRMFKGGFDAQVYA